MVIRVLHTNPLGGMEDGRSSYIAAREKVQEEVVMMTKGL
jgi:hypothetical protein